MCNCLIDEGRPLGTGLQEQVPDYLRRVNNSPAVSTSSLRFRHVINGSLAGLPFQADVGRMLKFVELLGTRRLWHPHYYLHPQIPRAARIGYLAP
jgi:hypothetical protein